MLVLGGPFLECVSSRGGFVLCGRQRDRLCVKAALPDPNPAVPGGGPGPETAGGEGQGHRWGWGRARRDRTRSRSGSGSGGGGGGGGGGGHGQGGHAGGGNGGSSAHGKAHHEPRFVEQTRDWSAGFSLDAVNMDQSLTLHSWPAGEGGGAHRLLEIGFVARPAPGRLGLVGTKVPPQRPMPGTPFAARPTTVNSPAVGWDHLVLCLRPQVVYFFPRLVVVNLLERPIAVCQPDPRAWQRPGADGTLGGGRVGANWGMGQGGVSRALVRESVWPNGTFDSSLALTGAPWFLRPHFHSFEFGRAATRPCSSCGPDAPP